MAYQLILCRDQDEFAQKAADEFGLVLQRTHKRRPNIVLPTGNTPQPMYQEIVKRYKAGQATLNQFTYVALDEYWNADRGESAPSFAAWIVEALLEPLEQDETCRQIFNRSDDIDEQISKMENYLAQNAPLEAAFLGLGSNGHIGFNEPGTTYSAKTQAVKLTANSLEANRAYWGARGQQVTDQAVTIGLGSLMRYVDQKFLLVRGAAKAQILYDALHGEISENIPASILQNQQNLIIIADRDAAALLPAQQQG